MDPKRNTPRHIISKLPKIKDKERILKAARGKEIVTYKGVPIILSADFSKENLQVRRGWKEVFEVVKGKDLPPKFIFETLATSTSECDYICNKAFKKVIDSL